MYKKKKKVMCVCMCVCVLCVLVFFLCMLLNYKIKKIKKTNLMF